MKRFFKNAAFKAFAVAAGFLLFGSLLSFGLRGGSSPLNSLVALVFSPLQGVCTWGVNHFRDALKYFESSAALRTELEKAKNEVAALQERVVDYDEQQQKLSLYEEFLEIKRENPKYDFQEASIIAWSSNGSYDTFTLNRGTLAGIKVQNPVLLGYRLAGVVVKADLTSCVVQTVLNPALHVGVYETATLEVGTLSTAEELSREGYCSIQNLQRSTSISAAGLICTSGLGGVFPKNLIIGTVREIRDDEQALSAIAVIEPAIDFSNLRDVFVLRAF
ncbi:MAG: rod shape-determining protein MreC [Oscillospiraceae bacterium]|nr:rod shape-determining protein MreC [Oscillospiraceae bacterium]